MDADDLAQDVFVVAFEKQNHLRDPSSIRPWLYGICRRVVAYQRRRRRFRETLLRLWQPFDSNACVHSNPEGRSIEHETECRLYQALDRLSEKKREALILFALEGMGGPQIAEMLGIPVATVWTRLHGARKDIVLELQEFDWCEPKAQESAR
jgi:RNA polymerase sigma-70 factor, ECF subfamily